MNPELMNFVEWLLRHNIHFTVSSAFRTLEENESCGGSKTSQHLTGDAIDLIPYESSVADFISKIKSSGFKYDQLIQYRSFVHISFPRGRKTRQMDLNFTDRK